MKLNEFINQQEHLADRVASDPDVTFMFGDIEIEPAEMTATESVEYAAERGDLSEPDTFVGTAILRFKRRASVSDATHTCQVTCDHAQPDCHSPEL